MSDDAIPASDPSQQPQDFGDAGLPTKPESSGTAPAAWTDLALRELQARRDALEAEIRELEARQTQLQQEIGSSFAGQSDAIARRLKGFQDYLVGALQELAISAEQMELVVQPLVVRPSALDQAAAAASAAAGNLTPAPAAAGQFSGDAELIRDRLARASRTSTPTPGSCAARSNPPVPPSSTTGSSTREDAAPSPAAVPATAML